MPSIVKIPLNGRVFPGLVALSLAVAVLVGVAPRLGRSGSGWVTVVDVSPSCHPPARIPAGAIQVDSSDLEAAMARAAAQAPGRPIRLITDGCHTGPGTPALPGVPVDVVLRPRRDNVRVLGVDVPGTIETGVDFAVTITVGRTAGALADPVELGVYLTRDGRRVGAERHALVLRRGEQRAVRVRDRVLEPGEVRYRAVVEGATGASSDDHLDRLARVGHEPWIGAIGEPPPMDGLRVTRHTPRDSFDRYDAVVLTRELVSLSEQERLARAVEQGLGLIVLGGGGFGGKPLERVLPLTDTPPGGRALLLLLDFSGSMEPVKPDLLSAIERLREFTGPEDLLAAIVFRDQVVHQTAWMAAKEADWDFSAIQSRGNTRLEPALEAAVKTLWEVSASQRRLIVVSDGEWTDVLAGSPACRRLVNALENQQVQCAALFVGDEPPEVSVSLFTRHARAADDLRKKLLELEKRSEGRFLAGPIQAAAGEVAGWLGGAVPAPGPYRSITRLYPRGVGERIALRAEEAPVVGAIDAGGRVVVVAADVSANPAVAATLPNLLRAVLRSPPPPGLRAVRMGTGLRLEARSEQGGKFVVEGREVMARPAGPGSLWSAELDRVPAGQLRVRFGGGSLLVPAQADRELAGLQNCRQTAEQIARKSGGRLFVGEAVGEDTSDRSRSPWLLLGLAVAAVLGSAWMRRKS